MPTSAPIAISPLEAAQRLSIDISTFYRRIYPYVRSGAIQSLKIGGARRIIVTSFNAWVEREAQYTAHMDRPYQGGSHG